jgi:DNA-binding response OmpR family regulator
MWLTDFWSDIDAAVKDARDGLRQPGASVIEDQLGIPLPRLELPEPDSTNVPTVLILDDDLSFVQAVEAALGEAGIAFEALLDSVRVFDALEKVNPDLLLLDLQMPGLSGFDVCRMVRESPQWQSLPIICVSGHSNAQVQTAVFQSGADDFIVKPFDKAELIARIHSRALRYRQSKAQ